MEVNSIQSFMASTCKPKPQVSAQISSTPNYSDRGAQLLNVGPANVLGMAFTGKSHQVSPDRLRDDIYKIYIEDYSDLDWSNNEKIRPIYAKTSKAIKECGIFSKQNPTAALNPMTDFSKDVVALTEFQDVLKHHITKNARMDFYDYFDKDCREFDKTLGTYQDVEYYNFSTEKLEDLNKKATNIVNDLNLQPNRFREEISLMKEEKAELNEWLKVRNMSDEKLKPLVERDIRENNYDSKPYDEWFNVRGNDISQFITDEDMCF